MYERENEIGNFLRASRARLSPVDVGLSSYSDGSLRRVAGLRREEVAVLAGVSADYYARLEQGRTEHASWSVLSSIASALKLDAFERKYLFALSSEQPAMDVDDLPARQPVRRGIRRTVHSFDNAAAYVMGPGTVLLELNSLAKILLFDPATVEPAQRTFAHWIFMNPNAKTRFVDWDRTAWETAAVLRTDVGRDPNSATVTRTIDRLHCASSEFRRMWSEHRVYQCVFGRKRLLHPAVGAFELDYEGFDLPLTKGQKMLSYSAAEGSPSERALQALNEGYSPTG